VGKSTLSLGPLQLAPNGVNLGGVLDNLRRSHWCKLVVIITVLCGFGYRPLARLWAAKSFLASLSNSSDPATPKTLREPLVEIPNASGPIRARLYLPSTGGCRTGIVVAHGIHYRGIEERRLVPFARALAKSGLAVLTPELSDLADYRLTQASVDRIVSAVTYLSERRDLVEHERVGLLGFSFAGGLSLVAAADPRLVGSLGYVVSVGGHHELDRVFRFLLTNEVETPSGMQHGKAHDYGLAVVTYAYLDEFLEEPELTSTRDAYRAWLHEDRTTAQAIAKTLGGEGARLFRLLEQQELGTLADELRRIVERHRQELKLLSPAGQLKRVTVPIYLLHGSHDSVIPSSETSFAELELRGHPHQALVTPLIEHVEVSGTASWREKVELLAFMAHLF
jgi:dienelactone hydrolase